MNFRQHIHVAIMYFFFLYSVVSMYHLMVLNTNFYSALHMLVILALGFCFAGLCSGMKLALVGCFEAGGGWDGG